MELVEEKESILEPSVMFCRPTKCWANHYLPLEDMAFCIGHNYHEGTGCKRSITCSCDIYLIAVVVIYSD
jgi:hypothetical protein